MTTPATPVLLQRLTDVHEHLSAAGIDHAVGGAIALAVHVREPRFTADIDLNVLADADHPQHLLDHLPPEVHVPPDTAATIRRDGQVRLFWPDPRTPLDLFFPQHPRFHAQAVARAEPWDFLGPTIKVLQATDLIVFKALFARPKDWVDISAMAEAGAGDLDEATQWIDEILGSGSPNAVSLAQAWADGVGER
jgi:hypothetical protein